MQGRLEADPLDHRLLLLAPQRALDVVDRRYFEFDVDDLVHLDLRELQLVPDLRDP